LRGFSCLPELNLFDAETTAKSQFVARVKGVKGVKAWSAGGVGVGWAFQEQYALEGRNFLQGRERVNEGTREQEISGLAEAWRVARAPGLDGRTMLAARGPHTARVPRPRHDAGPRRESGILILLRPSRDNGVAGNPTAAPNCDALAVSGVVFLIQSRSRAG